LGASSARAPAATAAAGRLRAWRLSAKWYLGLAILLLLCLAVTVVAQGSLQQIAGIVLLVVMLGAVISFCVCMGCGASNLACPNKARPALRGGDVITASVI
jgi:uncharacterized membrane protein YhaH (DUF805 family)